MSSEQSPGSRLLCISALVLVFPLLTLGCATTQHQAGSSGANVPVTVESDAVPRYDYNRLRALRAQGVNATLATLRESDATSSGSHVEQRMFDWESDEARYPLEPNVPRLWPCKFEVAEVISEFGPRSGRQHKGIDIRSAVGTPIFATADGTVRYSGGMRGYGQVVIIDHGDGLETVYAHLNTRSVRKGERVSKNEKLGQLGATGNATTPHVHYEVRVDGKAINPNFFLPATEGMYLSENE